MLRVLALLTCLFSPTCAVAQYYDPGFDPWHYDPRVERPVPNSPFYGNEAGMNRWHRWGMPRREYYGPYDPGSPRRIPAPHNYRYYPGEY